MVTFSILGPLEARRDGELLPLGEGRARLLLATLLLEGGKAVSRDHMIDALWGDSPPDTAAKIIQVYVSRLRATLGREAIVTHGTGYAAAVDDETLDALRFERLAAEGAVLVAEEPARAATVLDAALELWRGSPLADLADPSLTAAVARLEEVRVGVREDRLAALLALGGRSVAPELEALVADHPLRERPVRLLMIALYRAGRQADALETYRRTRARLADGLGLEPSTELQELERAILNHAPELFPPSAEEARASSLPTPATSIVGRELALEEIVGILRRPGVRLLTLTGPPGIGKTRLSLEAAALLAAEYSGRASIVPLSTVVDPDLVLPAVAQALGIATAGAQTAADALRLHLRDRSYLLVLDNFEQVLGAAAGVAGLLATSPQLKVIVTSREPLHVGGEHEVAVRPLPPSASVELFVQRAEAVRHDFVLDGPAAGAVAGICARLDGLPLAIELAAARIKVLPPPAILSRLGNRLDLLRSDARDVPRRHQTLRATIDWSYDLLEPPEQELLALLSVFTGSCGLEEVEAVAGREVLDQLASLVDKSLVQRAGDLEPRFSLLEIIREYAAERLAASGRLDDARARHAEVFLELAERWEPPYFGAPQREALDRLELDHENLRSAITFLLEADPARALRLVAAIRLLWEIRGPLAEGRRLMEAALERSSEPGLPLAMARNAAGILAAELGDQVAARRHFEGSVAAAREGGYLQKEASALANLANLDAWERDYASARTILLRAEQIWISLGDRRRLAINRLNLGAVALAVGELEGSRLLLREGIEVGRELGDFQLVATGLRDLGRTEETSGDVEAARSAFDESLALMQQVGMHHGVADCLEGIAALFSAESAERAARLFGAAEELRTSLGARRAPDQQDWYDRKLGATQHRLGQKAFEAAFAEGRLLTLDEALAATQLVSADLP